MVNYKQNLTKTHMEMLSVGYGQLIGHRSRRRNRQKGYVRRISQLFLTWFIE